MESDDDRHRVEDSHEVHVLQVVEERKRWMYNSCLMGIRTLWLFLYAFCMWLVFKYLHAQFRFYSFTSHPTQFLLDSIDLPCNQIEKNESVAEQLKKFKFDPVFYEESIMNATDKCSVIRSYFNFPSKPLSLEEEEFPLAYGAVIYKQPIQILLMISSLYQPQNYFCLAIDGSAGRTFKTIVGALDGCFHNIHVMRRPEIKWGSFEIINSTFECLRYLTETNHKWKYFQYIAGVDVPLKTNLEMVRIFKALNGTVNTEIKPYQPRRAWSKKIEESPLPLYKSSLSALIPRATADKIATSVESRLVLSFLKGTGVPDEGFWTTLTGNVEKFPIAGGLSAVKWLETLHRIEDDMIRANTSNIKRPAFANLKMERYYISRHQLWGSKNCHGRISKGSCIFGVQDVPNLLKAAAPIGHKLYIDYQPAALICILKVELSRGVTYDKLSFPELITSNIDWYSV